MMCLNEVTTREVPKFVKLIESNNQGNVRKSLLIKEIIEDVFNVSVQRGLTDNECSLLLRMFRQSSIGINDKLKLLQNLVPENKIPTDDLRQFFVWFFKRYLTDLGHATSARILQWIIGLIEHNLMHPEVIYTFYDDLYIMLEFSNLVPYAAKLLCKLTKPADVTNQTVGVIYANCDHNKYILAILNVFKGYKPHLVPEDVKKVDVPSILNSVPQNMDSVMKVRGLITRAPAIPNNVVGLREIHTRHSSYFSEESNKMSSLIPLPTYCFEGMDKLGACYPHSIEEAFKNFVRVPIPQNILSLMHNDAGFFTIMYQSIEVQMRFQYSLLQTLQNALIYDGLKTSSEDVEFLFRRIYSLQTFMNQGIPSVSVFLSGYLLDWEGVDHRYSILKLIEWTTFHSFRELACNILRPLYALFVTVTNGTNLRKEIIQTLTNLIKNMFADVSRAKRRIPFPFMKRGPEWTKEPETMLRPLIDWTQHIIVVGMRLELDSTALLPEAILFYNMVNRCESASNLPMFTVVEKDILYPCLLSDNPNNIIRLCNLLLRYHRELLPQMRVEQFDFYEKCKGIVGLTANYAQQVITFLLNGQVFSPRRQNAVQEIKNRVENESLAAGRQALHLERHLCFLITYICFESKKNRLDLTSPEDRRTCLELASVHLREIREFLDFFSPSRETAALDQE